MGLTFEHATITPDGKDPIAVQFNPNKYSLDKSNQLAEIGIPGLGSPILQFVRGNCRTLSMELFFDTFDPYEQEKDVRKDVRDYTNQIYQLLAIDPTTHVPPICTFRWGNLSFRCVLERVGGQFTLFLADGTPAQATLNVVFKEFIDEKVEVRKAPNQSSDRVKTHVVKQGETLSSIAEQEYADATKWRAIAEKNHITNPRKLQIGTKLVIPALK